MKYKATVGLTFPATEKDNELRRQGKSFKQKRVEAGDTTTSIPIESVDWLLKEGLIKEVKTRG